MKLGAHIPFLGYFRALVLTGGGALAVQGTTLIISLFIANLFGPIGLAKFSVTQNTIVTLSAVCQFGLGYTALNFVARNRAGADVEAIEIVRFCLVSATIVAALCAFLVLVFSDVISVYIYGDTELIFFVCLSAVGIPFVALSLVQHSILNGLERYASIFSLSVVSMIASLTLVFAGSIIGGLQGAAVGFVVSLAARSLMLHFALSRALPLQWSLPSMTTWRHIRSFAIPAGLAGLSLTPSTWFANAWLIKHAGLETQGLVLAALTIRTAISLVPQQLATVMLPRYLRADDQGPRQHRYQMLIYGSVLAGITGIFCIGAFLFRNGLFQLFGNEFRADAGILALFLAAAFIEAVGLPFSFYYARREKMWAYLLTFTYPKDLILVVTSLVLIPAYGGIGVACAYLSSAAFGLISLAAVQIIVYVRLRLATA